MVSPVGVSVGRLRRSLLKRPGADARRDHLSPAGRALRTIHEAADQTGDYAAATSRSTDPDATRRPDVVSDCRPLHNAIGLSRGDAE